MKGACRVQFGPSGPHFFSPLSMRFKCLGFETALLDTNQANIMPLITSSLLLRTLSTFHLTLAYYLLTSPATITTHNVVGLLGASLNIPSAVPTHFSASNSTANTAITVPNAATAFLALIFFYFAIADFTSAGLRDEVYHEYWGAQAPVRLILLFGLEAWIYLTKPADGGRGGLIGRGKGPADWLRNDVVFSWAFLELVFMFWVYNALGEERKEIATKLAEKEARKRDHL